MHRTNVLYQDLLQHLHGSVPEGWAVMKPHSWHQRIGDVDVVVDEPTSSAIWDATQQWAHSHGGHSFLCTHRGIPTIRVLGFGQSPRRILELDLLIEGWYWGGTYLFAPERVLPHCSAQSGIPYVSDAVRSLFRLLFDNEPSAAVQRTSTLERRSMAEAAKAILPAPLSWVVRILLLGRRPRWVASGQPALKAISHLHSFIAPSVEWKPGVLSKSECCFWTKEGRTFRPIRIVNVELSVHAFLERARVQHPMGHKVLPPSA